MSIWTLTPARLLYRRGRFACGPHSLRHKLTSVKLSSTAERHRTAESQLTANKLLMYWDSVGACGSALSCGTMLQAGIFQLISNPSSRIMDLRSIQPLTKMSTRDLLRGKLRPASKSGPTAICERLCRKCVSFDVLQPYEPSRPVTVISFTFY
jgi:hypothetical protein